MLITSRDEGIYTRFRLLKVRLLVEDKCQTVDSRAIEVTLRTCYIVRLRSAFVLEFDRSIMHHLIILVQKKSKSAILFFIYIW